MTALCFLPPLVAYALAALLSLLAQRRGHEPQLRTAFIFFWGGLMAHTIYLPAAIFWPGAPYFSNHGITVNFFTWACAVLYAWLARAPRWHHLAVVYFPLIAILAVQSLIDTAPLGLPMRGNWLLPLHLVTATLALAIFLIGFASSLIWLLGERQLKSRRPTPWWLRVPALPNLERTILRVLSFGFLVLTVALLTGLLLPHLGVVAQKPWHRAFSLAAWAVYAFVLNARRFSGWRGRKWIVLSLAGFVAIVLSMLEVHGV